MAAKDPERYPLQGPLVDRPVLSHFTRRPRPVLSTASTAINPGHIASLRESNRQNSAEGNSLTAWTIDAWGQRFFLDNTQYTYFGCRAD
ncbi:hypothetical protein ARMSODRAFT_738035 [Armillaria solidipes]|uniref:Uncharacterized protein n=1 Tax=Armillaria solidipes TaxID=1076256 RepID=A0A2H3BAN8_9AGAR|nr:hypothetical protein ARMSODRAFT_738035 [Armillaria solidipes]